MKGSKPIFLAFISVLSSASYAWEANVTEILQHGNIAAIYLNPDPGKGQCEYGQPYILAVDGTPESDQRFSMLLTALTAGKTVRGYDDGCSSAIWEQSRPAIGRLAIKAN